MTVKWLLTRSQSADCNGSVILHTCNTQESQRIPNLWVAMSVPSTIRAKHRVVIPGNLYFGTLGTKFLSLTQSGKKICDVTSDITAHYSQACITLGVLH